MAATQTFIYQVHAENTQGVEIHQANYHSRQEATRCAAMFAEWDRNPRIEKIAGPIVCTCKPFRYQHTCHHIVTLARKLQHAA